MNKCRGCSTAFEAESYRTRYCGAECQVMHKVSKTEGGCWEWGRAIATNGYGVLNLLGKVETAHRYAHSVLVGPIPVGKWVLHRCDNRRCVNPAHLFLGDHRANMDDMTAKGRAAWHGKTRPSEQVEKARQTRLAKGGYAVVSDAARAALSSALKKAWAEGRRVYVRHSQ